MINQFNIKTKIFQKSDDRIFCNCGFIEKVSSEAQEQLDIKYTLDALGIVIDDIAKIAATLQMLEPRPYVGHGKSSQSKNRKPVPLS